MYKYYNYMKKKSLILIQLVLHNSNITIILNTPSQTHGERKIVSMNQRKRKSKWKSTICWEKKLKIDVDLKTGHQKTYTLNTPRPLSKLMMDKHREFRWVWTTKRDVEQLKVVSEEREGEIMTDIEHFLKVDLSLFCPSQDLDFKVIIKSL